MPVDVLRVRDVGWPTLRRLLEPYGLEVHALADAEQIPGSYWGETEAGLIASTLYARLDTPVHSVLHEAAHFVCMDAERRARLERDAGGDFEEENAVCYLQILWGDTLEGFNRERMWRDMDAWGYTFRLGSAQRWFEEDAADARTWLERFGIVDVAGRVTGLKKGDHLKP
jgi:hypothetical protein